MAFVRTSVIMKTDIRQSAAKTGALDSEGLRKLLVEHEELIVGIASQHEGSVVKGEGDAFWITYPSVTAASLAALDMQEKLRASQSGKGDEHRTAIRIVITLGDVLHQENDIFGMPVILATRIEAITPADEIYLSQAAWLALNKGEIQTSFVNEFAFKGFPRPMDVYRIRQEHRSRLVQDQVIAFTDLRRFTTFCESAPVGAVEELLTAHTDLHEHVCREFGGTFRNSSGDKIFLTFTDARMAVEGLILLRDRWEQFLAERSLAIRTSIRIAVHRGDFYILRSLLFGQAVNVAGAMLDLAETDLDRSCLFVSGEVFRGLIGTELESRLSKIEYARDSGRGRTFSEKGIDIYIVEVGRLTRSADPARLPTRPR